MIDRQAIPEFARLRSLLEIAAAELHYLKRCDARLFAAPLTDERIRRLPEMMTWLKGSMLLSHVLDGCRIRWGIKRFPLSCGQWRKHPVPCWKTWIVQKSLV